MQSSVRAGVTFGNYDKLFWRTGRPTSCACAIDVALIAWFCCVQVNHRGYTIPHCAITLKICGHDFKSLLLMLWFPVPPMMQWLQRNDEGVHM